MTISAAFAQAPSGQQSFNFSPQSAPLIDITGSFSTVQTIDGGTPLVYSIEVTNSSNGRVLGAGVTLVQIGEDFVAANYVAVGNVTGGGLHPTRVSVLVRLWGTDVIAHRETDFNILLSYNLFFNPDSADLEGTVRGSIRIAGFGSGRIREDFTTVPLNNGIDGSWTADLFIIPLNRLSGTGTISLPNGRTLQGIISGTFSARTGISRIKLTGFGADKGFSVTFTATEGEDGLQLETVRGRILGQSVFE